MKTTTSLVIAAGAVIAVVGIASAVNAESDRCDRSGESRCGEQHHDMRGPDHAPGPMGHRFGGPAGPMMGHPVFAGGLMGPMIMQRVFELADADTDGKLTQAEISAARTARFDKHDANGDGALTLEEFDSLLSELTQPVTVRAFQFLDPDGDAAITRQEFERPTSRFVEFLDRNDDGMVSRDDRPDNHHGGFHHGRYDRENGDN